MSTEVDREPDPSHKFVEGLRSPRGLTGDMTTTRRPIEAIAQGQHGYFTSQQAADAGLTRAVLRRRVNSGNLDKLMVRTFTSGLLPPNSIGALRALLLDIGEPVWACGPTAAALHGFDGFRLSPPYHVVTERSRNVRRLGHVVHTTIDLPVIDREATAESLAVTSPTRTIIDLARWATAPQLTAALDSALRDRLTTETFLHRRINALGGSGRYGIPRLLAIVEGNEITRGGHSWLERRFLELIAAAGLPRPTTQAIIASTNDRLIRVDCRFDSGLVVEVLGYRWHRTAAQMQRDAERMNRLMLDGHRVLQFTYAHVAEQPEFVTGTVAEALVTARPHDPTSRSV